ncbi:ribokinase-like [Teleopsis dalmanni]|uniref:ribokinase-like n=1 Tax=Teleopsis dalmanni TaxID=139649 RepID=UPI0018CDB95E|nr:ribokinase-like [Teleopsis dalmanni]XP_037935187.1 ribokinase-like [Teleopsis dalmanni]
MEVLVFGSAIVDFISYVERLPRLGETLKGRKFATGYGGKGANQCVAAARLGASTAMIAKLGDDSWGNDYLEHLRQEGVDVEFTQQCKNETTGVAQISVSDGGDNCIIITPGANDALNGEDVSKAEKLFTSCKILICQLEVPVESTLHALQAFKGISILNAAPALQNTPIELLKSATIFCVNESEAALMTGAYEIVNLEQSKEALMKLQEMGANTVVITLGSLGAVYVKSDKKNEFIHVPSITVEKVVDTTGAGDAFIGALAYFMAKYPKSALHQQIGAACRIASYSVQYPGTQSSFPNQQDMSINLDVENFDWFLL